MTTKTKASILISIVVLFTIGLVIELFTIINLKSNVTLREPFNPPQYDLKFETGRWQEAIITNMGENPITITKVINNGRYERCWDNAYSPEYNLPYDNNRYLRSQHTCPYTVNPGEQFDCGFIGGNTQTVFVDLTDDKGNIIRVSPQK